MPNHWETSARPLFVKTVFVNGNRHAILFEKDPLLRCAKKISRPNSSLSFTSDLSLSFSESQDSSLEVKEPKHKNITHGKDLSSELQSCLVKLKLASGNLEIQNNSNADKYSCRSKELKRSQSNERGSSKQKRHKWGYEKICRRKQREQLYGEPQECQVGGKKNIPENSCYVYNLENYRGKKKYCFVKISSQPPQFILNCCCEKSWNETHNCDPPNKNNLVISATIHNLVMTSEGDDNILRETLDYIFPFQNAENHWNNYLTKSYYNSLSERVFQWMDLARKRKKQQEKLNATDDIDLSNISTERIFSGKTFVGDKSDFSSRQENGILLNKKPEKITRNETVEDIEGEVTAEPNVETLLSTDNTTKPRCTTELQKTQNFSITSIPNSFSLTSPNSNVTETSLKIQDLMLNFEPRNQKKRKIKESRNPSPYKNKSKDIDKEGKDFLVTTINSWEKKINDDDISRDKFDTDEFNGNVNDFSADKIKNPILTEEFAEGNKKSINNLNITRARPVLIQNLLSPQQHGKVLEEEKIVWGSEKNTGRPQLHIFMPSILLKDQSDDSMSECESYVNL